MDCSSHMFIPSQARVLLLSTTQDSQNLPELVGKSSLHNAMKNFPGNRENKLNKQTIM